MLGYEEKLFGPSEFRQRGYVYMPNYIRKVKGGYKVFSKAGKPLSKEPKAYDAALRQLGAVEASKARRAANSSLKGSKRLGPQTCEYCGREFDSSRLIEKYGDTEKARMGGWICPYCGHDNVAGRERWGAIKSRIGRAAAKKRWEKKNPPEKELGHCFELSAKLVLDFGRQGMSDARLVHGIVTNTVTGKPMLHGWVEIGDVIFDPQADAVLRKERFYQVGNVRVPSLKKYTAEEAAIRMLKTGHFGPWELELENRR